MVKRILRVLLRSLTLAHVMIVTVACGGDMNETTANQADMGPFEVQVELDLFSGNPNPVWSLTEAESATLVDMLAQRSPTSSQPLHDGLGYRGFLLAMTSTTSGESASIRVQGEVIAIDQGGTVRFLHDGDRKIEQWLLETGKPHIDHQLYQSLKTEQQGGLEDE